MSIMSLDHDGSLVTSPLYAGTTDMVVKMQACAHTNFEVLTGMTQALPDAPGCQIQLEKCRDCLATRARVTGPADAIQDIIDKAVPLFKPDQENTDDPCGSA